jgi:hypothetical protein
MDKKDKEFWKDIKNINNSKVPLPVSIDGVCGPEAIAKMWLDHYSGIFNMQRSVPFMLNNDCMFQAAMVVTADDIDKCIKSMATNKAAGPDGLTVEHFRFCSKRVLVILAFLFTAMFIHGYLPSSLIESLLMPIVKNKCASLMSKDNYRPIALSNVITKVLERIIVDRIDIYIWTQDNQFGFKTGSEPINVFTCSKSWLTRTLCRVATRSSIFSCFLDASKAFDRVNHYKLMCKLRSRGRS